MAITKDTKFRVVTGTDEKIQALEKRNPGYVYFASDTGKIYLDVDNTKRLAMGGSGASILYGVETNAREDSSRDHLYLLDADGLEGEVHPKEGDLIIDSDGTFYKILAVVDDILECIQIAVSGTGTGGTGGGIGGGIISRGTLKVTQVGESNIINGSNCYFDILATSGIDEDGPIDEKMSVMIEYFDEDPTANDSAIAFLKEYINVEHNKVTRKNVASNLRLSATTFVKFTLRALSDTNSLKGTVKNFQVTSTNLTLSWSNDFTNNDYFNDEKKLNVKVNISKLADRILDIYFDNELVASQKLNSSVDATPITITKNTLTLREDGTSNGILGELFSHGSHTIKAQLSLQTANGDRGDHTDMITKEIALALDASKPVIWVGDLDAQYYEYDKIFVPYRVYDPNAKNNPDGMVHVYLEKDSVNILDGSYRTVNNNASDWSYWEITDLSIEKNPIYTIRVGQGDNAISRNLTFKVLEDPRHMAPVSSGLKTEFYAKGRSNTDAKAKRETLLINGKKAIFENFNWYNNGWITEKDKTTGKNETCLRISNGAKLYLPLGAMTFGSKHPNSIEFRMKIRNVQDYSTIVSNYTRYKYENDAGISWNDNEIFEKFKAQKATGYSSYDAYLTKQLPIEKENAPEGVFVPEYDELEFDSLYKDYNLANAAILYMGDEADVSNDPAICFGPQDGFFSNGTNSVTANFVENEIISISISSSGGDVMNGDNNLMKIFVNGMLTSLARSTKSIDSGSEAPWYIGNTKKVGDSIPETYLVINSEACDIDLYSLRIYNSALNIPDVLHNYAYDNTDTQEWDFVEQFYTVTNSQPQFSYAQMIAHNDSDDVKLGKKEPLMPYIVFTTDDTLNDKGLGNLPWFKTESEQTGESHYEKVDMEFVNPALDIAYNRGILADKAKEAGYTDTKDKDGNVTLTAVQDYYLHHCPSWTSTNVDLGVQGTSSEFYPRRNYKAKTKVDVFQKDEGGNTKTKVHYLGDNHQISYTEYLVEDEYEMIPHRGPFKDEYNAYALDSTGTVEPRRMDFFYYDNNVVGTNKFTLKIDFMESSGSYNMGLANLVNSAYSKHPLSDYVAHGAIGTEDPANTTYTQVTEYEEGKTYFYKNHKGNWKSTTADELKIASQEDFDMGPVAYAASKEESKVLTATSATGANASDIQKAAAAEGLTPVDFVNKYLNKWYKAKLAYKATTIPSLSSYRTSVQGFPTLAFHQTKSRADAGESPVFIGRYNMLLDKGADEAYGFKLDKSLVQMHKGNKAVRNIAECWEFENNSRGWCSFRDPWNRKELSFAPPAGIADSEAYNSNGAPTVVDSFEYRYNKQKDFIDLLTHLNNSKETPKARISLYEEYGIDVGDAVSGLEAGRNKLYEIYSNWEKACKWVWSTAVDAKIDLKGDGNLVSVPSLGEYKLENVAVKYETGKYFTKSYDTTAGKDVYTLANGTFDPEVTYYQKIVVNGADTYPSIKLTTDDDLVYIPNKFYIIVNNNYVLSDTDQMDQLTEYYRLIEDYTLVPEGTVTAENFGDKTYFKLVDKLYRRATEFEEGVEYYESKLDEAWLLPEEVPFGLYFYNFDTKEYRLAKFKNELTSHFSFEYLITYFVITEVLECYDSRGKNCMMASWGPQQAGGDYIWYPIFYDLDTQLGINNTGIPSFDYNIDATEEGTFSTNDSVLWNNLYSLFKNSISQKYQQLKGSAADAFIGDNTNPNGTLNNAPFMSVDKIEQYYSCDPALYNSYSMKGERPLVALNIDEYYKYIAITDLGGKYKVSADGSNLIAFSPVLAGYLGTDITQPLWQADSDNTYFYALQGNRSMSRRQFLTNRFNYLDSWLNVGNYARAGQNRIRSRVSANSSGNSSDKWIEGEAINGDSGLTTGVSYFRTDGQKTVIDGKYAIDKTHLFDGEYWIDMTPARSMYVTVGTDAANFPSLKYSGTPVRFKTIDLENGVRKSGNYREQLYYIYGLNQMKSLGDLSRLYFQEFALEGAISKLTDLKLGYDGLDEEGNEYKNSQVNDWTIPGSAESATGGMPLMKEVNLSNITFKNTTKTIDLSSCQKLENFRCTGSNITGVTFAPGVALNTAYLSDTINSLTLIEARLLTDLITEYEHPKADEDGNLHAVPGLYIKNLTDRKADTAATKITKLSIEGGNLGYNSYTLLKKYYESAMMNKSVTRQVNFTKVQWSPYFLIEDDEMTAPTENFEKYFVDDNHFHLRQYDPQKDSWASLLANRMLYEYDETYELPDEEKIVNTDLLDALVSDENNFIGISSAQSLPNISGIIHIHNTEETKYDEGEVQSKLQLKYPGLKLFFDYITPGYAARFVIKDKNGKETLIGTDKIGKTELATKKFFVNPGTRTESEFNGDVINSSNSTQDFLGWSTTNNRTGLRDTYDKVWKETLGNDPIHTWDGLEIDPEVSDYTFYAVFEDHFWTISYYVVKSDGSKQLMHSASQVHGSTMKDPNILIVKDETSLPENERYTFLGWTERENATEYSKGDLYTTFKFDENVLVSNKNLYAMFMREKVTDSATNEQFFHFDEYTYSDSKDPQGTTSGLQITPAQGATLAGKITIPTEHEGKPVISIAGFNNQSNITAIYWYGPDHLVEIGEYCFNQDISMKVFSFPTSLRFIGPSAFGGCSSLKVPDLSECEDLRVIGNSSFNAAFYATSETPIFTIPGSVTYLGQTAFSYNNSMTGGIGELIIGSPSAPTQLATIGSNAFIENSGREVKNITVYCGGNGTPSTAIKNAIDNGDIQHKGTVNYKK